MAIGNAQNIAVIGAGIAGAACAHALTLAGHSVHAFDKSSGPGGRLAIRRVEWVDRQRQACTTRLDYGAVGITARSEAFQSVVDQALHAGCLAEWAPKRAAGGLPADDGDLADAPEPALGWDLRASDVEDTSTAFAAHETANEMAHPAARCVVA